MILGTAGHIDHGKTALVRALTGVDTDRLPEEKRRGITIDLGFAPLVIEGTGVLGIVDVPGHEGFVRTMLAGASGIDLALLVIAADEGVMPQTREHLEILSLLRIQGGIVALTKSDLVEDDWLTVVRDEARELITGTALDGAPIVPVSVVSGSGVSELRAAIARAADSVSAWRPGEDLFRMPVDRAFTVKGTGTVVTGTVWNGVVKKDDAVTVLPAGSTSRVRTIQSHGRTVDCVRPGQRAAIALGGLRLEDVGRGSTVVIGTGWSTTREISAAVEFTHSDFVLSPKTRFRIHLGTAETGARLAGTGRAIERGASARLLLDEPMVARGGDRFILRLPSPARTVGGGEVLDPHPPRRRRALARAHSPTTFASPDRGARLMVMLEDAAADGLDLSSLEVRSGLAPNEVDAVLDSGRAVLAGGRAYSAESVMALEERALQAVVDAFSNQSLEPGVSLQAMRAAVGAPRAVIDVVVDRLKNKGRIEQDGSFVRPAGSAPAMPAAEKALSEAILHEICVRPSEPPSVGELVGRFGERVYPVLRHLERGGELERVSDDRYYSVSAVAGMIGTLRSGLDPGRIYTPAELREVLGVSRKYLIPFLEFCDRRGVTERLDRGRKVRRENA